MTVRLTLPEAIVIGRISSGMAKKWEKQMVRGLFVISIFSSLIWIPVSNGAPVSEYFYQSNAEKFLETGGIAKRIRELTVR